MGEFPRKILVSYGFGAGWSTWSDEGDDQFVCEYQPIIDFIEAGGDPVDLENEDHPLTKQFLADLAEHRGKPVEDTYFCLGGADGLVVKTVHAPYRIEEYDGSESVRTQADTDFIH